jgi:short-subunit dehydrogenase
VLITGVSTGIGFSLSKFFLLNNFITIGVGNKCNSLLNKFRNFYFVKSDLRSINYSKIKNVLVCLGTGAAIINNAGYSTIDNIYKVNYLKMLNSFNTMVFYPIILTHLNYRKQRRKNYGYSFFICSLGGLIPIPYMSSYSICKSSLLLYSKCLSLELPVCNFKLVSLILGDFKTRFNDKIKVLILEHIEILESLNRKIKNSAHI